MSDLRQAISKKPQQIYVLAVMGLALTCATPALGQGVFRSLGHALTEQDAVELALSQPAVQALSAGTIGAAGGDVVEAQTLPNPIFSFERWRLSGTGDEREVTYRLSQRFDIAGKRSLRTDAARSRLTAAESQTEGRRNALASEVRRRFYEILAIQFTVAALTAWERRLQGAEALAQTLEKGGEVAGYDRRRLGRERATALARIKALQAELGRSGEGLQALIGPLPESSFVLTGHLLPNQAGPLSDYLARLEDRPDLKALTARTQAFAVDEQLARRNRIPDITLSAGFKQLDLGMQNDSGVVFSVAVPLPILDRSEGPRLRAAGQAQATVAERDLALAKAQGDVRGLWKQASQLRSAAQEFRIESVEASMRLAQIAEAAYRGGETGILELLDAYRASVEADTRAIELELAARLARIELEFVSGGGIQ